MKLGSPESMASLDFHDLNYMFINKARSLGFLIILFLFYFSDQRKLSEFFSIQFPTKFPLSYKRAVAFFLMCIHYLGHFSPLPLSPTLSTFSPLSPRLVMFCLYH
jgi:hypothetical protein